MVTAALTQSSPTSLLAVRGRGIARLIRGLSEGDPVAWAVLSGVVVISGGWYAYKYYQRKDQ